MAQPLRMLNALPKGLSFIPFTHKIADNQNIRCSSRRSQFHFMYPHSGSQLSVTPLSGQLVPSSGLSRLQKCVWHTNIHIDTHKINKVIIFLKWSCLNSLQFTFLCCQKYGWYLYSPVVQIVFNMSFAYKVCHLLYRRI